MMLFPCEQHSGAVVSALDGLGSGVILSAAQARQMGFLESRAGGRPGDELRPHLRSARAGCRGGDADRARVGDPA